jgi:Recombination endonuclease VII
MSKRVFRSKIDAAARNAAAVQKLAEFTSDTPCLRGHVVRSTRTGQCKQCTRDRGWRWIHRSVEAIDAEKERCRVKQRVRRFANPGVDNAATAAWRKTDEGREAIKAWRAKNRDKLELIRRRARGLPIATRPKPAACECCGREPSLARGLHLDHCHVTGEFRGWLCMQCNNGIGFLGDTAEGLRKVLKYLEANEPAELVRAARFRLEMDDIQPEVTYLRHAARIR